MRAVERTETVQVPHQTRGRRQRQGQGQVVSNLHPLSQSGNNLVLLQLRSSKSMCVSLSLSLALFEQITAVCDTLTYLRYMQLGLVKSSSRDIYWHLMDLRKQMTLARLGLSSSSSSASSSSSFAFTSSDLSSS